MHLQELGIATLSAVYCNLQRDPKKSKPIHPREFFHFSPEQKEEKLNPVAADAFFDLVRDKKMPQWAVGIAPIPELRSSRAHGSIPACRAWLAEGVLLLLPRIVKGVVKSPLAIIDEVSGPIKVVDVDTGDVLMVLILNDERASFCETDLEVSIF